jgi:DNA polymerase III subunit epsilon
MREIVLDTETTGLDPAKGHRIVEIGCVERLNAILTSETFHVSINPERDMPEEAFRVHGLSAEFLAGKPVFAKIADDFLKFTSDANIIAHNAEFDLRFLNSELARLDIEPIARDGVIDTLALARRKFPGEANSLDALCVRYGIDTSRRTKHGALLDAEILAEVYAKLTSGQQADLVFDEDADSIGIDGAESETIESNLHGSKYHKKVQYNSKNIGYICLLVLIIWVVFFNHKYESFAPSGSLDTNAVKYATINTSKLNMRSCPSTECSSIAMLTLGTRVKIIDLGKDGWSKIERQDEGGQRQIGYVNDKFLKQDK